MAQRAGLRFEGLSYAARVLTKSPRFAEAGSLQRIVSNPLPSKGKLDLFACVRDGVRGVAAACTRANAS